MKTFVALASLLCCALARPSHVFAPLAYTAVAAPVAVATPVEISSQYHSQDNLGQYNYGYASGSSAKAESRSLDGITSGSYSYVDPEGKIQSVQYTADSINGFRVAASNLPVGPSVPEVPAAELPQPVEDTPEVAEAKSAHLKTVEEVKARNAAVATEEAVIKAVEVPVVHTPAVPVAYSSPFLATAPFHYGAAPLQYTAVPVPYSAFSYAHNSVHASPISYVSPYYGYNTYAHSTPLVEAKKA